MQSHGVTHAHKRVIEERDRLSKDYQALKLSNAKLAEVVYKLEARDERQRDLEEEAGEFREQLLECKVKRLAHDLAEEHFSKQQSELATITSAQTEQIARNDELQETVHDLRLKLFHAEQNSVLNLSTAFSDDLEERVNEITEFQEKNDSLRSELAQAKESSENEVSNNDDLNQRLLQEENVINALRHELSEVNGQELECNALRELASAVKLQAADASFVLGKEVAVCAQLEQTNETLNEEFIQQTTALLQTNETMDEQLIQQNKIIETLQLECAHHQALAVQQKEELLDSHLQEQAIEAHSARLRAEVATLSDSLRSAGREIEKLEHKELSTNHSLENSLLFAGQEIQRLEQQELTTHSSLADSLQSAEQEIEQLKQGESTMHSSHSDSLRSAEQEIEKLKQGSSTMHSSLSGKLRSAEQKIVNLEQRELTTRSSLTSWESVAQTVIEELKTAEHEKKSISSELCDSTLQVAAHSSHEKVKLHEVEAQLAEVHAQNVQLLAMEQKSLELQSYMQAEFDQKVNELESKWEARLANLREEGNHPTQHQRKHCDSSVTDVGQNQVVLSDVTLNSPQSLPAMELHPGAKRADVQHAHDDGSDFTNCTQEHRELPLLDSSSEWLNEAAFPRTTAVEMQTPLVTNITSSLSPTSARMREFVAASKELPELQDTNIYNNSLDQSAEVALETDPIQEQNTTGHSLPKSAKIQQEIEELREQVEKQAVDSLRSKADINQLRSMIVSKAGFTPAWTPEVVIRSTSQPGSGKVSHQNTVLNTPGVMSSPRPNAGQGSAANSSMLSVPKLPISPRRSTSDPTEYMLLRTSESPRDGLPTTLIRTTPSPTAGVGHSNSPASASPVHPLLLASTLANDQQHRATVIVADRQPLSARKAESANQILLSQSKALVSSRPKLQTVIQPPPASSSRCPPKSGPCGSTPRSTPGSTPSAPSTKGHSTMSYVQRSAVRRQAPHPASLHR
eukprot:gnl/MRDRNA2_/MRDRNA2_30008_c0_seq1.p1 gnl/MRDRNA2_/MRDRNA2_30008_c0~~gnl/MRDRNA2_/MRDRNA2_30008_c0_seq1.p1  ORF type:complete len:970 (+),score=195.55 gnl/MRDRNA2_/MRDRNA2_30008_c0_seq1:177-3086(+)